MNHKAFLVTTGNYSDYTVCAVFSSKALAESYINSFIFDGFNGFRIEEYIIDPYKYELKEGYKPYFIRMTKGGNCIEIMHEYSHYQFTGDEIEVKFDYGNNMLLNMYAKDEKHAVKIANEKRVQLIAENKWKQTNKQK